VYNAWVWYYGYTIEDLTKKDIPRIELGLLDSKSNVLTITPYVLADVLPPTLNNKALRSSLLACKQAHLLKIMTTITIIEISIIICSLSAFRIEHHLQRKVEIA
jgi:hypothetical protein